MKHACFLFLYTWGSSESCFASVYLGDKDTFRIAWMATRTPYALPSRHVGLVGYTTSASRTAAAAAAKTTAADSKRHGSGPRRNDDRSAAAPTFNGHAMLQHHHVTGEPVFLHRNQRKWDPRVLNAYPPDVAGWGEPRVLTAAKVCRATLTVGLPLDFPFPTENSASHFFFFFF